MEKAKEPRAFIGKSMKQHINWVSTIVTNQGLGDAHVCRHTKVSREALHTHACTHEVKRKIKRYIFDKKKKFWDEVQYWSTQSAGEPNRWFTLDYDTQSMQQMYIYGALCSVVERQALHPYKRDLSHLTICSPAHSPSFICFGQHNFQLVAYSCLIASPNARTINCCPFFTRKLTVGNTTKQLHDTVAII